MRKGISFFFVGLMVSPLSLWMFSMFSMVNGVIGDLDFSCPLLTYPLLTYTLLTLPPLVIAFSSFSMKRSKERAKRKRSHLTLPPLAIASLSYFEDLAKAMIHLFVLAIFTPIIVFFFIVTSDGCRNYSANNGDTYSGGNTSTKYNGKPGGGGRNTSTKYNDKPVIYLYPQQTQSVTVKLAIHNGTLSATYPEFDTSIGGWKVSASNDGRLIDARDGREYSYLFWESAQTSAVPYDLSKGFVVKGSEVRAFLSKILPETGLTPREYNEFIVYWYPRLMNIPLMQIYFAGKDYTDSAQLSIEPPPDSMLRVFMVVRPLKEPIHLVPQKIHRFERKGFSVVEWGGTLLP